jgi:hypothetical protein
MTGVTMHARGTLGLNAANPIISLARSIRVNFRSSKDSGELARANEDSRLHSSILSDPIIDRGGKHDHHRFSGHAEFCR